MNYYFKLQYKRIYRYIDAFGLQPFVGILIIGILFYGASSVLFNRLTYASYFYLFFPLFYSMKLGNIKRNHFLKNCFNSLTYKKIRIYENIILALPFAVFLIYKQEYKIASLLILLTTILSQVNKINSFSYVIPTPFYKKPFEFIVGFRRTFWVFILAYCLTYIAISVSNFNLGVFSLLAVIFTTFSYYSDVEPSYYVWIYSFNAKDFFKEKIKTAIIFNMFLISPIVIALILFFPTNKIDILLLSILFGLTLVLINILGKYSDFPSKITLKKGMSIALCFLFPPIIFVLIPYLYSSASNSLNKLLK